MFAGKVVAEVHADVIAGDRLGLLRLLHQVFIDGERKNLKELKMGLCCCGNVVEHLSSQLKDGGLSPAIADGTRTRKKVMETIITLFVQLW